MPALESRLIALATAIGTETKSLRVGQGVLGSLNTSAKTNLVAAVNEVLAIANAASGGGVAINDALGDGATTVTWSANKIYDELVAAIAGLRSELLGPSALAALNTFDELAAAMGDDPNFAATIATGLGNRVRVDAVQTFTEPQKLQARNNIGAVASVDIGNPDTDLVAVYNTARA